MKWNKAVRAFLIFILSLFVSAAVFVAVLFYGAPAVGERYKAKVEKALSDTSGRFCVSYSSIDRKFLSKIVINGIEVSFDDTTVLSCPQVSLSAGVLDFIRMAQGKDGSNVNVSLNSPVFYVDQKLVDWISSDDGGPVDSVVADSGVSSVSKEKTYYFENLISDFSDRIMENLFDRCLSVSVTKASIDCDLDAVSVRASDTSISITISNDLGLIGFSSDMSGLAVDLKNNGLSLEIDRITGKLEEIGMVSLKAGFVSCEGLFQADDSTILLDLRTLPEVSAVCAVSAFHSEYKGCDVRLQSLKLDAGLSIENPQLVKAVFSADSAAVSYKTVNTSVDSIKASLVVDGGLSNVELSINSADVSSPVFDCSINLLDLEYDKEDGIKATVFQFNNEYLTGITQLSFETSDLKHLKGSFVNDGRHHGCINFDIESGDIDLDIEVSGLKVLDYSFLYNSYVPFASNFITNDTAVNGKINAAFNIMVEQPVFDVVSDFEVRQIKLGNNFISMEASIDVEYRDNTLNFRKVWYSTLGKKISFSGLIDLNNFLPVGTFVFSNKSDDSYLAHIKFEYDSQNNSFSFSGAAPGVIGSSLYGEVVTENGSLFRAVGKYSNKYIEYPLEVVFDRENDLCTVTGSGIDVSAKMDSQRYVVLSGKAEGFELPFSDNVRFGVRFDLSGGIDLFNTKWKIFLNGFSLRISDAVSAGFDLEVSEYGFEVTNINVRNRKNNLDFNGVISATGLEFAKIIKGDFSAIRFKVDLNIPESNQLFRFGYSDKSCWADINLYLPMNVKLSLLSNGGKGNASAGIGDLTFDFHFDGHGIVFDNAVLGLEDTKLESFDFYIDFASRSLNGTFGLTNILHNKKGDIRQGTTVSIGAKLDSLRATALSLAGIEAKADFDVSLKNTYLGDDFTVKDNDFKLTVDNKSAVVSGEMIQGSYVFADKTIDLKLDKSLNIGLDLKGAIGQTIDVMVEDIWFDSILLNQMLNTSLFEIKGGVLTGNLLVFGDRKDPKLYGMLYSDKIDCTVFYTPDQVISIKSPMICLEGHKIYMPYTNILGYSYSDGRQYAGKLNLEILMTDLSIEDLNANLIVDDKPLDMWMPLMIGKTELMMRGDITGSVDLWFRDKVFGVSGAINADNFYISFKFPPELKIVKTPLCAVDLEITIGSDVKLHYPDLENSFLTFTFTEGDKIHLYNKTRGPGFNADGDLFIKSGRIYYINNELLITDGKLHIRQDKLTKKIDLSFDATAKLREYDSSGQPVDVFFIFKNSTFDNLAPTIESSNGLSQNEILKVLGQQIVGSEESRSTLSSFASMTASATGAIRSLGIISNQKRFSIASSIKESLNLDVFSLRSQIFQNILIDSLPVESGSERTLLSRYLDGSSLFVGKYIGQNMFLRGTAMLNSVNKSAINNTVGHFISEDLNLDFELSFDCDVPFGTLSLFTQPQELSIFSFIDNFGISLNNHIKF